MSTDCDVVSRSSDAAPNRRAFLRRSGLVALGAAATAPVFGPALASAEGGRIAYLEAPNTFTANQTISAQLGIGVTPLYPLEVANPNPGAAVYVNAHTMALLVTHERDWEGQTFDLVNAYHKSTGDAIFIAHQGGVPTGYTGSTGGCAALNLLVPYYLDDTTTGRNGSVVNTRTGMKGLFIQTQATASAASAVNIDHYANAPAVLIRNQFAANPRAGAAAALEILDGGTTNSIMVRKESEPGAGEAALVLRNEVTEQPITLFRGKDKVGNSRAYIRSDGTTVLGLESARWRARSAKLQVDSSAPGVQDTLALTNYNKAVGDGCRVEWSDGETPYSYLEGLFEGPNGSLLLSARSNGHAKQRLGIMGAGATSIYGGAAESAVLQVQAAAAQTGDMLDLVNSSGQITVAFLASGTMKLRDGVNVETGQQSGTKIGTSRTQRLAFWNALPVSQPSGTPAAATNLASALALVNSLRQSLVTVGLVS